MEMEARHQPYRFSYGGGSDVHPGVNIRATTNNNIWIGTNHKMKASSSWDNYVMSPPRKELHSMKVAKKKNMTSWWNEPERKRKRRVAKYKFYAAEGKIKRSIKKGFRWLKMKCIDFIHDT